MVTFIIAVGVVFLALAGYILWQAYLLDLYRQRVKELEPPF